MDQHFHSRWIHGDLAASMKQNAFFQTRTELYVLEDAREEFLITPAILQRRATVILAGSEDNTLKKIAIGQCRYWTLTVVTAG